MNFGKDLIISSNQFIYRKISLYIATISFELCSVLIYKLLVYGLAFIMTAWLLL